MTFTLPNEEDMLGDFGAKEPTDWRDRNRLYFDQPHAWIIYFGYSYTKIFHDDDLCHWDTAHYNPKLPCNCSFFAIF
jgi:hypothetical protein